jgi:hypothetical protein
MSSPGANKLKISQKVEILLALFRRTPLRPLLDGLTDAELVAAHEFLWSKLVEIHYLTQDSEFVREEVTKQMVPSATYQHQQGCDLRLDYCKGVECIWSNPVCAGTKVKNNMEVMARIISRYIDSKSMRPSVFEQHANFREMSPWILQ